MCKPATGQSLSRLMAWSQCLTLILVLTGLSTSCAAPRPVEGEGPWNLTIFHTNDMHGAFLSRPASWRDDRAEVGGMIALAGHLATERRDAPVSVLLDAGDFMTGNPICEIEVDGIMGAGFLDMMNQVGYDVGVIGNHEFDLGRENARALAARAAFPLLAAEILNENGEPEFDPGPVILQRGDLSIGVMGVSTSNLFALTTDARTGGLSLRDQGTVVSEMITAIDEQTDLLVLISHNGFDGDKALARRLAGSGLDIIVGGHSHTRLKKPVLVGDILIVQAGSKLTNLGRLDLQVQADRVVSYRGRLVELTAAAAPAPDALTQLVHAYQQQVETDFGQVIGQLQQDWRRSSSRESNIGNWIADRLRERASSDVAFMNSGGIRKDLPAGPITLLDIYEILPFANTIVTFELTGEQLLHILEENAHAAATGAHGILQVSGIDYRYRKVGDHVELASVEVGGERLLKDQLYQAAAPDYVVASADVYFAMPQPPLATDLSVRLSAAIIAAIQVEPTVVAEIEGRIRDITGTPATER